MLHNCYPLLIDTVKLNVGNTHDVGKDTGCCYAGTGTISLNHHRVFLVAFCGEQYDIVGTFEIVEWVLRTYSLQTYTGLSLVKGGNEAPALVLHIQSLALSLKVGIELWQFLPELINATLEERVRYKKILFYIFLDRKSVV